MNVNLMQVLRELDGGKWRPVYLIVGEEPFQTNELRERLKDVILKDETARQFNYESWDGEHLDENALVQSLDTLPGLFDGPDAIRLVVLSRFEKAGSGAAARLEGYFKNPSPTTCFAVQCAKADKRKAWYKAADGAGAVVEVQEPYDRDWPRWQGYFEKKAGKRLDPDAWALLVEASGRSLSVLWAELQKAATFVGDRREITAADARELFAGAGAGSVFDFVDDVLCRRGAAACRRFEELLRTGENEIKMLSLLVRQFRLVEGFLRLSRKGEEPRAMAPRLGVHPFFMTQIQRQSRHHTAESLSRDIARLARADFRLKTGDGTLFDAFLGPYFAG